MHLILKTNAFWTVVKETLEARGTLGQIRARIRAEVYNALDDPTDDKPEISSENFIINELILEYLEFNKYKYAASVLRTGELFHRQAVQIHSGSAV